MILNVPTELVVHNDGKGNITTVQKRFDAQVHRPQPEDALAKLQYDILFIKNIADGLLYKSDWTQLPDNELSDEDKIKWKEYRSEIRKMRKDAESIAKKINGKFNDINWPVKP